MAFQDSSFGVSSIFSTRLTLCTVSAHGDIIYRRNFQINSRYDLKSCIHSPRCSKRRCYYNCVSFLEIKEMFLVVGRNIASCRSLSRWNACRDNFPEALWITSRRPQQPFSSQKLLENRIDVLCWPKSGCISTLAQIEHSWELQAPFSDQWMHIRKYFPVRYIMLAGPLQSPQVQSLYRWMQKYSFHYTCAMCMLSPPTTSV